jgi:hypothetical protein
MLINYDLQTVMVHNLSVTLIPNTLPTNATTKYSYSSTKDETLCLWILHLVSL